MGTLRGREDLHHRVGLCRVLLQHSGSGVSELQGFVASGLSAVSQFHFLLGEFVFRFRDVHVFRRRRQSDRKQDESLPSVWKQKTFVLRDVSGFLDGGASNKFLI